MVVSFRFPTPPCGEVIHSLVHLLNCNWLIRLSSSHILSNSSSKETSTCLLVYTFTTQFMPLFYISLLSILIAIKRHFTFSTKTVICMGAESLLGTEVQFVCVQKGEGLYQSPCLSKRGRMKYTLKIFLILTISILSFKNLHELIFYIIYWAASPKENIFSIFHCLRIFYVFLFKYVGIM